VTALSWRCCQILLCLQISVFGTSNICYYY